MPLFHYYGRDSQGKPVSGNVEQASDREVALYLSENNIIPVDITLKKNSNINFLLSKINNKKVIDEQLILFSRQMQTIYRAGLPLHKGLDALIHSLPNHSFKVILVDIAKRLRSGLSFSKAMQCHPEVFDQFFIGMVAVGEGSGQPEKAFSKIGDYLERDLLIKKNIKAVVRYPLFVLFSIVVALLTINFLVIPAFTELFSRLGNQLPLATQLLLGMSNFLTQYAGMLFVITVIVILVFRAYGNTTNGRLCIDRVYYKLPFVGKVLYKAGVARYTHALSSLLSANLTLNHAMALAAGVINNRYLKKEILLIKESVERGESLYSAHYQRQMFSPLVLQMIYLGEETASIDTLLAEVAESYEREIDYDINRISSAIEPLLILILAIFVGILAVGVFLPMWSLFEVSV